VRVLDSLLVANAVTLFTADASNQTRQ
jgi:hypothetical protein